MDLCFTGEAVIAILTPTLLNSGRIYAFTLLGSLLIFFLAVLVWLLLFSLWVYSCIYFYVTTNLVFSTSTSNHSNMQLMRWEYLEARECYGYVSIHFYHLRYLVGLPRLTYIWNARQLFSTWCYVYYTLLKIYAAVCMHARIYCFIAGVGVSIKLIYEDLRLVWIIYALLFRINF